MSSSKVICSLIFLAVISIGAFAVFAYTDTKQLSLTPYAVVPLEDTSALATSTSVTSSSEAVTIATTISSSLVATATTSKVTEEKIKVLVVAGHEPTYGGSEYKTLKERDMTVRISKYLSDYLRANPKFEVIVVRDEKGWNPVFADFFTAQSSITKEFYLLHKATMAEKIESGEVTEVIGVPHNAAPEDVALHLYGINRWADAHAVDLVLHIHLNDVPRKNVSVTGEYSGMALYVPERQYANSSASLAIGRTIFPYLMNVGATSTLPTESGGVIEDQELIALGKYNTLKAPSILIEYGYIYENQFQNSVTVEGVFKKLALQTYKGIEDYFSATGTASR